MKLECLGKLPFGMYAEMERSGVNLNEIDTTDCEHSLQSLQLMAQRLYDPQQMRWASEPDDNDEIDGNDVDGNDGIPVKMEPNEHAFNAKSLESHLECHSPKQYVSVLPQVPSTVVQPQHRNSVTAQPVSYSSPSVPLSQAQPQQPSGFTSTRSNTCHLCGQTFKSAKFLQVHLYCDHQEQNPSTQTEEEKARIECDICHKAFDDVAILQQVNNTTTHLFQTSL